MRGSVERVHTYQLQKRTSPHVLHLAESDLFGAFQFMLVLVGLLLLFDWGFCCFFEVSLF